MDHLNLFAQFENRPENHEDILTRNFLILVKNIPQVQNDFFKLIQNDLSTKNTSLTHSKLKLSQIYTQTDSKNDIFNDISNVNVLSIIISDDRFKTLHEVKNSDRHARYDGVITFKQPWVFIIENKPSVHNAYEEQLDINLLNGRNISIQSTPCTLSWRDILLTLNKIAKNKTLKVFERTAINDFIEYVDYYYSFLNPYQQFDLCKSNEYLLNRRCNAIMESYSENAEVKHHKGWKNYIDIESKYIQKIALDSEVTGDSWAINLWAYFGDTMNLSKAAYKDLNVEKLFFLKNNKNYTFSPNFHFSFSTSGLVWTACNLTFEDYIKYWKNHSDIKQIKRDNFKEYFDFLVKDNIIESTNFSKFNEKILSKNYPNLNVCPGFLIKYTWQKDKAIALDKNGNFEDDFKRIISEILSIFE